MLCSAKEQGVTPGSENRLVITNWHLYIVSAFPIERTFNGVQNIFGKFQIEVASEYNAKVVSG
jgi:hypothetical protein